MKRFAGLLAIVTIALGAAPAAHGVVVASNLGNSVPASPGANYWPVGAGLVTGFDPPGSIYEQLNVAFTTDANAYQLDSIEVDVLTSAAGPTTPLSVSIYANVPDLNSFLPGALLGTLSGTTSPNGVTSYTPASTIYLAASTRYHVVVAAGPDSTYKWQTQDFLAPTWAGPGTLHQSFSYYYTNTGNALVTHQLNVATNYLPRLAVNGTVVPEVSSALLAGIAACGLGVARRLRTRSGG